jgi:HD-GYP domain-containing protein (c-di-GMP phosphodiesterase class II)
MARLPAIPLVDLLLSMSEAMDLVCPSLVNHHKQVAYVALSLAAEMDWPREQQQEVAVAGVLHDAGALSTREKLRILRFDAPGEVRHGEIGYRLLRLFEPFSCAAQMVRYHHTTWRRGAGAHVNGQAVPPGSHLLHLADRVAVLVDKNEEVLSQVRGIVERVEERSGDWFVPEMVEAFRSLAQKEYFWFDLVSHSIGATLRRRMVLPALPLDAEPVFGIAEMFSHMIDFRSRFTAAHSSGLAANAETLARLLGFSEEDCRWMRVAANLHDLGKLAVPTEILEKPGGLTPRERDVMRSHTYHTYRVLEPIAAFKRINAWAAFHHERLDGKGYPFHLKAKDLSAGSRIMAVADAYTACTEDRPYRKSMGSKAALQTLQTMARESALDADIVRLLELHQDEVNSIRRKAQARSLRKYQEFMQPLKGGV